MKWASQEPVQMIVTKQVTEWSQTLRSLIHQLLFFFDERWRDKERLSPIRQSSLAAENSGPFAATRKERRWETVRPLHVCLLNSPRPRSSTATGYNRINIACCYILASWSYFVGNDLALELFFKYRDWKSCTLGTSLLSGLSCNFTTIVLKKHLV